MKSFRLLATFALLASIAAPAVSAPLQSVLSVDLTRYAGQWHEIASIPQSFQVGCECTTAIYTTREDGGVGVVNSCERLGITTTVEGKATVVDQATNARLSVDFGRGDPGSYVVIGLDADYKWAVVSSDDDRALWILSRTRKLAPEALSAAIQAAATQVDLTGLKFTDQRHCE